MDINLLLKSGMRECGRVLKLLPESEIGSPQKYMMDILREETLPSIDIIHPMILKKSFSTNDLIPIELNEVSGISSTIPDRVILDDRYSKYRIPLRITDGHEITGIKSLVPLTANHGVICSNTSCGYGNYGELGWGNRWGRPSSADLYGTVMASMVNYADRQLLGNVSRNFRFYFYPPNILLISNYVGSLNASICVKNDENLISIDDNAFEAVKRLFLLDLKKSVYNEFGNFTEIDTPYGTLDLKIQDWSSAYQERNEYFDNLNATAHFRKSSIRS